jgi:type VI secretion system ImpA/VasJ family protein
MNQTSSEVQVPARVVDLLKDIASDFTTGKDASADEAYFKLEMEIGKVSPDYKVCGDFASEILAGKSKDLRVASWLCFSWYRDEKIPGLINGLTLISELLRKFGGKLFPPSPVHRGKSLQFLNSSRVVKLLEAEQVSRETLPLFLDLSRSLERMMAESRAQLGEHAPELKQLGHIIAGHAAAAKQLLETPPTTPPPGPSRPPEKAPTPAPVKEPSPAARVSEPGAASLKDVSAASEKEAIVAVKKALKYFFEQEKDESKKNESYVFGISRALVWGKAIIPSSEDDVTPLSAPDGAVQNKLKEWYTAKEWDRLIPAIELNFLDEDSGFKYWLTAQRYVHGALEQKGGGAVRAAEEVKFQLARLLQRFPDFIKLKFSNKTPFADDETSRWVDESVRAVMGKGGGGEAVLPPILGEDYEPVNREYRTACAELPANFEKNLKAMQQGMAGEILRKGRFLRILNLANYSLAAKQHELAKTYVSCLLDKIEAYQLAQWEPALCLAAWESAYLVNKKLMDGEKNKEHHEALERQQKELFARIGNIDGVLALRLARLK